MHTAALSEAKARFSDLFHASTLQGSSSALDRATADLISARIAAETPAATLLRLRREVASQDRDAAYHAKEEASLAGRIAACRKGNPELAEVLEIQRRACARLVERHTNASAALSAEADAIAVHLANAGALIDVVG